MPTAAHTEQNSMKIGQVDSLFTKSKLSFWVTSLALLGLLILAYGLMLFRLGFAFDDWHFIYYATRGAQGLVEIFGYDGHTQETWLYVLGFKLLGYKPLYWHLSDLICRWLAVVSFWLCLKSIWPLSYRLNFFVAALFAVHPIYTLQVFPICFLDVWITYTLLFLSFYFTIAAVQYPEKGWMYTLIAVALAVARVFTSDYILFVELMRPVFIWLALPVSESARKKMTRVFMRWLPFFMIFMAFLIWRGFFAVATRKHFQVPPDLLTKPFNYLLSWGMDLIPDIANVLIAAWYETLRADYLYFARPFNIILFIGAVAVAIVGAFYLRRLDAISENSEKWANQAMVLGLPSMLFGILPFYIASYALHFTEPPFNSRFTLGMLPGAALITAALLEKLITRQNLRVMVAVVLVSLAVSWHIRYTNEYRKIWVYQADLLQQLTWRVPGVEAGTVLYIWQPNLPKVENSIAGIALYGDFPLAMAVNGIYAPNPVSNRLPYWYVALHGDQFEVRPDAALHFEHATTVFDGNSTDSLFFYYDPEHNRCLHLISAEDQYYKQYPETLRQIAPQVATERIRSTLNQNIKLRDEILGRGTHSWCYYYQSADLARQFQQWDLIPALWQQAWDDKVAGEFGVEYIPFIDGFAHVGEWQKARELTTTARKLSKGMNSILCPLWGNIEQSTMPSAERDETIQDVRNSLACESQ